MSARIARQWPTRPGCWACQYSAVDIEQQLLLRGPLDHFVVMQPRLVQGVWTKRGTTGCNHTDQYDRDCTPHVPPPDPHDTSLAPARFAGHSASPGRHMPLPRNGQQKGAWQVSQPSFVFAASAICASAIRAYTSKVP